MAQSVPSAYYYSSPPRSRSDSQHTLVYFITGNPGLIAYYETFLSHLHALLSTSSLAKANQASFDVCGRSLLGFETSKEVTKQESWAGRVEGDGPPFGLQAQIEATERSLKQLMKETQERGQGPTKVVLMGHSVGSYILLEILRRHRERLAKWRECDKIGEVDEGLTIVGGVCLFPTVTNIAKSKSGRRLSWVFALPSFALIGSWFVKLFFFLIPRSILTSIIRLLLRFPIQGAGPTAAFLKSPHGVREALYMAKHEMATITEDTWDAEVWGAAHPSPSPFPRPKLFFLFGKDDHWVANETRDELIKARAGQEDWKPQMEVDEVEGWPHGFSIRHSVPVAEKVTTYVEKIVQQGLQEPR